MVDNRNISFEESDDPQARQTNETVYMLYTRDPVRTPFQWDDTAFAGFSSTASRTWLPVHANYPTRNLKAQKAAEKSTFKLYKKLIELRKSSHVLAIGGYESMALSSTLFGFKRTLSGEHTIAVFVNLGGATTASLKDLMGTKEFNKNTKGKVLLVNNNCTIVIGSDINVESLQLGAYDAIVIEVSSAAKLVVSMMLIVCSLIKFIF